MGTVATGIAVAPRVRRTVAQFYATRNYAQLSNYTHYLAQHGATTELQFACGALDVMRGGVWFTAAEERADEEYRAWKAEQEWARTAGDTEYAIERANDAWAFWAYGDESFF